MKALRVLEEAFWSDGGERVVLLVTAGVVLLLALLVAAEALRA